MNKDQRKYLVDQITKTLNEQVDELQQQRIGKPSLNNYIIAAFLDNSIKFQDIAPLQKKLRERVIKMGKSDVLIEEDDEDDWRYNRRNRKKSNHVKLIAEDIFVIPETYLKALKEYQDKENEIDEKIKTLQAQAKTIEMKIQIGSPDALNKLVTEIDNLVDLQLVNSKFLLGDSK